MDKRKNRRLIAGVIALALGLFAATLYAARGRRVSIDQGDWEPEVAVDFDADSVGGNHAAAEAIPLPDGMILKIGSQSFDHVWINANGFISLTDSGAITGTEGRFQAPGPRSFDDVTGNVIAPFYADAQTDPPSGDCNPGGATTDEDCDVAYGVLQEDPVNRPRDRAFRVTWGFGDGDADGVADGLLEGGSDASARNRFQVKLIDRSHDDDIDAGDFDIEFTYDAIRWEKPRTPPPQLQPRTLVGLQVGTTRVDFSKFFDSFVLDPDGTLPPACEGDEDPFGAPPSFTPARPLLCNGITIEVRNGMPKLATYTADVSVQLLAGGASPIHTTDTFPLGVQLFNGNDDLATNVTVTLQLPNDTTVVSAPQGVTCTPSAGSAECNFGSLDENGTRTSVLNLRSMQDGARTYSAEVAADQYDFDELDNKAEVQLNLAPSADVAVTTCTAPSPITQGTGMVVQCSVRNNGPQSATNVAMTADLPAFVTFVSGSGCTASNARVTCTAPTLAKDATTTFALTLNTTSTGTGNVSATVDAAENDPVANNNTASAGVTILAQAVVVDPPPTKKGGGSLSIWLLLSLALLTMRQRSCAISR